MLGRGWGCRPRRRRRRWWVGGRAGAPGRSPVGLRRAAARRPAACGCVLATATPLPLCGTRPTEQGGRYDDNVAVFGRSLQAKMESLRVFLVRAGRGVDRRGGWAGSGGARALSGDCMECLKLFLVSAGCWGVRLWWWRGEGKGRATVVVEGRGEGPRDRGGGGARGGAARPWWWRGEGRGHGWGRARALGALARRASTSTACLLPLPSLRRLAPPGGRGRAGLRVPKKLCAHGHRLR